MAKRFKDDQLNLDILAEEALEVAKVVSKIRRFGIDDFHPANGKPNRAMLAEEIGHFMFMVATLHAGGVITEEEVQAGMTDKSEKLPAWYRGWMEPAEHECCGGCAEPARTEAPPVQPPDTEMAPLSQAIGTYFQFRSMGWTDEQLLAEGHLIRKLSEAAAGGRPVGKPPELGMGFTAAQPCSNANCRSRREGQCGWSPKDYESCVRRDSLIATPGPTPPPVDTAEAKAAARDHSNGLLPVKPLKDEYPCFNSDCVVSWKPNNTCAGGFVHKDCAGRIAINPTTDI